MAWGFGRYVQGVAAKGRAEYALPLYVNAALARAGHLPGQYPSAGPLPHLFDVWRVAAPAIDFMAPDIYSASFAEWADRYRHMCEKRLDRLDTVIQDLKAREKRHARKPRS